jgi:hypothetical protein
VMRGGAKVASVPADEAVAAVIEAVADWRRGHAQ